MKKRFTEEQIAYALGRWSWDHPLPRLALNWASPSKPITDTKGIWWDKD